LVSLAALKCSFLVGKQSGVRAILYSAIPLEKQSESERRGAGEILNKSGNRQKE